MWAALAFINVIGPIAYFAFGRRWERDTCVWLVLSASWALAQLGERRLCTACSGHEAPLKTRETM